MDTILSALTYIQANLDGDLSLEQLAGAAKLSKYHFHRAFRDAAGVKQCTLRLRLERAAPSAWRRRSRLRHASDRRDGRDAPAGSFARSRSKVCTLEAMHLAFIRHVGPYEDVPDDLWTRLARASAVRREPGGRVLLGIGHDSPAITDAARLRYDAAVRVSAPLRGRGAIGHQVLPAATYAMATFVGPYASLPDVYPVLMQRAAELPRHRLIGLPCIEIYRTTRMSKLRALNFTDVYVPIEATRAVGYGFGRRGRRLASSR